MQWVLCLQPLLGVDFPISQEWLEFCHALQLGGLLSEGFVLVCPTYSGSLISCLLQDFEGSFQMDAVLMMVEFSGVH